MPILRNTRLLFWMNLFLSMSLYAPIEVIYLQSAGLPIALISLLNLSVPISMAAMEVPAGVVGDYLGRRRVLLLSALSHAASTLVLLLAREPHQFFAAYFLEGLAWSLYSGNTDAIVVEDATRHKADLSRQLAFFYSGLSLGPVISGLFNTFILTFGQVQNLQLVIAVTAGMKLLALAMAALVVPASAGPGPEPRRTPLSIMLAALRRVSRERFSLAVVVYEATGRIDFYLPVVFQPLALQYGFSLTHLGLIFAGTQVLQYLVQRRADAVIAWLGVGRILKWSPALLATGLLLLLLPSPVTLLLGLALTRVVGPVRYQCLSIQKNQAVDHDIRATYLSVISLWVLAVNSALLSLVGYILDHHVPLGIAGLVALCLLGLAFYRPVLAPPQARAAGAAARA